MTRKIQMLFSMAALLWLCWFLAPLAASADELNAAGVLRSRHNALVQQLSFNQFKRPLYLVSAETPGGLRGDIYALVEHPFAQVSEALSEPAHWCDMLILHINTKSCRSLPERDASRLVVHIGKKEYQALAQAFRVDFAYRLVSQTPEYLDVALLADKGPLGTSDYRIRLEAVSLPGDSTFLHITYAYAYNLAGRLAMQAYLATVGHDKVGFTQIGRRADGQPDYIGDVRGVVERNTMRYYLAIDAYLGSLATPPAAQLEQRLQSWFTLTELYPRQLHELDREDYLEMKRREYVRQKSPL
jgi:hypothetical protein